MFTLAFLCIPSHWRNYQTSSPIQHFLLYGKVSMSSDEQHNNFIEIKIPYFKHAKYTTATLRLYQNKTNSDVCPYLSLLSYLKVRKYISSSAPLFSFVDGSVISKHYFTQLWLALSFCNFDLPLYQTHSFCIGAAITAVARGFSELQIKTMGRWKTTAFKKYISNPTLQV